MPYFSCLLLQIALQVPFQATPLGPGNNVHLLHHGYLQMFHMLRLDFLYQAWSSLEAYDTLALKTAQLNQICFGSRPLWWRLSTSLLRFLGQILKCYKTDSCHCYNFTKGMVFKFALKQDILYHLVTTWESYLH